MRKFYTIVNVVTFLFMVFYLTSSNKNPQMQHGALVLGMISLLASGYMTFYEYTDDTEEKYQEQVEHIKNTYKSKIDEYDEKNQHLTKQEQYITSMRDENKQLVSDVMQTKKIVTKLTDIINSLEQPSQGGQRGPQGPDVAMQAPTLNYHMESPNQLPLSNSDERSGPPSAMMTNDGNQDISSRMKEYESFDVGKPPSAPNVPDFLKSINTSSHGDSNTNNMNY